MKPMKAEADRDDQAAQRRPDGIRGTLALGAEVDTATRDADESGGSDNELDGGRSERGNLWLAYQRWSRTKARRGSMALAVAELKDHLKQHWPTIRGQTAGRRLSTAAGAPVDIPKPQGGVRTLGIPTVVDRLIQQALHQVLQPIFEPTFSESSYGFRPGRNAHQAVRQARRVRGARQALGRRYRSGEVLRPGQPRPADVQAGNEDRRCTSADS